MSERQVFMRCKYQHDGYLWKVLAKYEGKYVVWDYNSESSGYSSGHYHISYGDAMQNFMNICYNSQLLDVSHIQLNLCSEVPIDFGDEVWEFTEPIVGVESAIGRIKPDLDVSVETLLHVFGDNPKRYENPVKTRIEWKGEIEGYHFTIYDYRSIDTPLMELRDWSIGGFDSTRVPHLIKYAISMKDSL